jgi:hypothetical protein
MRLSVRTGELDRVVSRTNSFNEISESQDLEGSVSFTRDGHETATTNSNNNTNPSSGETSPHKDTQPVAATVEHVVTHATETKPTEVVETKQEDKTTTVVAAENNADTKLEQQTLESPKSKSEEKVDEPKKESEPKISLAVKNVSPTNERANDKSPGRTQYSKSVSVAKIGKGAVTNTNERPILQRKKSKTTDDIVENKPTVEEVEDANLHTSGENDSENSPTPRRKRSFSDMSNIVVSNTKQKELEETNEEHAKNAQIQRQQSKNFLKSFYKSLKHSFSSTSKKNLVVSKDGINNNNDDTKEAKKGDDHNHDDKAHKKDKKESKKLNKQTSLGNVKDKDKIRSSKPSKSATSPNMNSNNTNKDTKK